MIFLQQNKEPEINVNRDLVLQYKARGDIYLVAIRTELTKQLVFYEVYDYWQDMCNAYYDVISLVLDPTSYDSKTMRDNMKKFSESIKSFLKRIQGYVLDNVIDKLEKYCSKLEYLLTKFNYIVEKILEDDKR